QRPRVRFHEHQQRSRRHRRGLQLVVRGWWHVTSPESVAHVLSGRQLYGQAHGHGQPGCAEHPHVADGDRLGTATAAAATAAATAAAAAATTAAATTAAATTAAATATAAAAAA